MMKNIGDQAQLLLEYEKRGFSPLQMKTATLDMMIAIDQFLAAFIGRIHELQDQAPSRCMFPLSLFPVPG